MTEVKSDVTRGSVESVMCDFEETVEEARVTAADSVDLFPLVKKDMVDFSLCSDVSASVLRVLKGSGWFVDELSETFMDRSVMSTDELEEIIWLLFKADSSVTEVETSGSVVADLLVRGLVMSFTYTEVPFVGEAWTSNVVSCLVVRWILTVFDNCSLVTVMVGPLMVLKVLESPNGLCVDE